MITFVYQFIFERSFILSLDPWLTLNFIWYCQRHDLSAENGFTGTFQSEIKNLQNLNVFDLRKSSKFYKYHRNLDHNLTLSCTLITESTDDNNFSGSIPNELGDVGQLKILNICKCCYSFFIFHSHLSFCWSNSWFASNLFVVGVYRWE